MVKSVIFTDFDGTITLQDSNDHLVDSTGIGKERRLKIFEGIIDGSKTFREAFTEMMDSVKLPYEDCIKILEKDISLDPGFKDTFNWAQENNVPIIVVSSGTAAIIRHLIGKFLGEENLDKLDIVANDIEYSDDGEWHVKYRDETGFGHDKSRTITEYKNKFEAQLKAGEERPTYFYCGDGVSDLSAAKECDLLFARAGKDLITYCKNENVPYHEFTTFADILAGMKQVLNGEKTVVQLMDN
ncbi:hypothetical protein TPHA_0O00700 [Tetrapisispora phaffii CBS 4417]|uniref:2,3-diketo-5-methylthio-1-phosphopentane phosphatase n=1 Tax=Tetrapisispora phaffii (strain ATCC 24235 / CBS 4417 / NBRC 1672 / NRRL Y-8282 / UCD 70-5) TaxID=1071381 RepID=G8C1L1_TETPH|nr:hypothetical protein TPHA_0O00700 [Tetrapisispora phaffii CBS 4417]CCE66039.1 hypothetical protein TPHA_0O00700 [Tetrapisispora phaffii CBS 4417]